MVKLKHDADVSITKQGNVSLRHCERVHERSFNTKQSLPRIGNIERCKHMQQRALSGTTRSDQCDELTAVDRA